MPVTPLKIFKSGVYLLGPRSVSSKRSRSFACLQTPPSNNYSKHPAAKRLGLHTLLAAAVSVFCTTVGGSFNPQSVRLATPFVSESNSVTSSSAQFSRATAIHVTIASKKTFHSTVVSPANRSIATVPLVSLSLYPLHSTSASNLATVVATTDVVLPETNSTTTTATPKSRGLIIFAVTMFVVGATLAASETAITTLWPWKVRELAEKEGPTSPFAVLDKDLTRFLTTILVTTTASTVFSTAIATDLAGEVLSPAGVAYFTVGITVFFLFFGEILPKALAVHSPAKVARVMVPVISTLSLIVFPVGQLLAACSGFILRILKVPRESDATVSEEELRLIVAGADRSGSIEKYEREIIQNVLDLEQKDVREVMCPRVDIVALEASDTLDRFMELERESRYSRMPVYEETIDNIIGVVYAKSLLRYLTLDPTLLETTQVMEIMDSAFFVMESMSAWAVLEQMRKRRLHIAVVVDEYGGTAGIVTLEDILEEVVGDIMDEDDDDEAAAVEIEKKDNGGWIIQGSAELDKVLEQLEIELSHDDDMDYETVSGFLCDRMGGIPNVGDQVVLGSWRFDVREADERRIISVHAARLTDDEIALLNAEKEGEQSDDASPLKKLIGSINGNGVVEEGENQQDNGGLQEKSRNESELRADKAKE